MTQTRFSLLRRLHRSISALLSCTSPRCGGLDYYGWLLHYTFPSVKLLSSIGAGFVLRWHFKARPMIPLGLFAGVGWAGLRWGRFGARKASWNDTIFVLCFKTSRQHVITRALAEQYESTVPRSLKYDSTLLMRLSISNLWWLRIIYC